MSSRTHIGLDKKGQIVLDPFMGSGTTCVAKKLKRKYWNRKEEQYFNIAKKRISHII